jgi:hypothetical protein
MVLATACTSPESTDKKDGEDAAKKENTSTKDTVVVETKVDNPAEVAKLKMAEMSFEDYAKLTTIEEIEKVFGAEQMKEGISYYAEGTVQYKNTTVTNPATTHEIRYVWGDNGELNSIEADYIRRNENFEEVGKQMTKSDCGIHLGMTLEELVAWNEDELSFLGFGWDFEGMVQRKENSKLSNCDVIARLGIDHDPSYPAEIMGDIDLNSTDENLKGVKIFITNFTYHIQK